MKIIGGKLIIDDSEISLPEYDPTQDLENRNENERPNTKSKKRAKIKDDEVTEDTVGINENNTEKKNQ